MSRWLCRFAAIALVMLGSGRLLAKQGSSITVKVLYDNYTAEKGLTADWGFSCLVTGTEKTILFDTGAKGDVLLQNMAKMNVSPDDAEVVVISHNHGDHTGGLASVLERNRKMMVYLPPSCPEAMVQQVRKLGAKAVTVTKPVEICRGVFVIGPTGDKIIEQALAVDASKGVVLITGCSHPGVIEIAKRAKEQLRRDIYMICGGMHLLEMSEVQVGKVIAELNSLGVQKIGATHCTGEKAIALFKEAFGDRFVELGVGRVLQIGIAKTDTNPVGERPIQIGEMPLVQVADDNHGFVLHNSGKPFVPWGFNYDHDENGRLLEDYWDKEWSKVEEDFREMKELGANVVRIHLQTAKFMTGPETTNEANLERLGLLVALAEKTGIYLDITGLACYRKKDVPKWYDDLSEEDRWDVQARFWEAVAARCAKSPAIFCYDLMNEPVVAGRVRNPGDWLGPPLAGGESGYFVQFITLDQKKRPRPEIARHWCKKLVGAIRKHDQQHLVTVGLVRWSLDRPGMSSGFVPKEIAPELDFIAMHLYPEKGKVQDALATLSGFDIGKPVVIEETFVHKCSAQEFEQFLTESRKVACGWIGFYWGKTPGECRKSNTIHDAIMLSWLEFFQKRSGEIQRQSRE